MRGTEYCGNPTIHEFQLFLALNDVEHTRTKARSPQTNGICERFHKTIKDEFYSIAFRRKIYLNLDELRKDLDLWLYKYNNQRTHQGKRSKGRTPMDTFNDNLPLAKEKLISYMDGEYVDGFLIEDHLTAQI